MIFNDTKMSQMSQIAVPLRKKAHVNKKEALMYIKTGLFTILNESVYLGKKVVLQLLHLQ